MKKKTIISLLLALALVASLGCAAFAAGPDSKFEKPENPSVYVEKDHWNDDWEDGWYDNWDDDFFGWPDMWGYDDDYFEYWDDTQMLEEYIASIEDEDVKAELTKLYEAYLKAIEEEEAAYGKLCDAEAAVYDYIEKLEFEAADKAADKAPAEPDVKPAAPEKEESKEAAPAQEEYSDEELFGMLMKMADSMSYDELKDLAIEFMKWYMADKT